MVLKEKRDLQVFPGNSHRMLFMPLRSAAFAQVLLRKTGCSATPRLAGKTTHSMPIVAAMHPPPINISLLVWAGYEEAKDPYIIEMKSKLLL